MERSLKQELAEVAAFIIVASLGFLSGYVAFSS